MMNIRFLLCVYIIPLLCFSTENYIGIKKSIILNDSLNQICSELKQLEKKENNLKILNAYDRSVEKKKINVFRNYLKNTSYIIKITSSNYDLGDYHFSSSNFEVDNIKLNDKLTISTDKKISLEAEKEDAKIIAGKKKMGFLDLYIRVKIKNFDEFSSNYCSTNYKKNIKLETKIYEYFFLCSNFGKVIYYKHPIYEEPFIKKPYITIKANKEIKKIFNQLENDIYICKSKFNGFGSKIYQINVSNKTGVHVLLKNGSSFSSRLLENCIDKKIKNRNFPKYSKSYTLYFSVVISNINKEVKAKKAKD